MPPTPEDIFNKLLRDENIMYFYKRKNGATEELTQVLDELECITISCVRRANQWVYEGDLYGFLSEKQRAIRLINLIRFLRNNDFESAIETADGLSNFDKKIIPNQILFFLNNKRSKNE